MFYLNKISSLLDDIDGKPSGAQPQAQEEDTAAIDSTAVTEPAKGPEPTQVLEAAALAEVEGDVGEHLPAVSDSESFTTTLLQVPSAPSSDFASGWIVEDPTESLTDEKSSSSSSRLQLGPHAQEGEAPRSPAQSVDTSDISLAQEYTRCEPAMEVRAPLGVSAASESQSEDLPVRGTLLSSEKLELLEAQAGVSKLKARIGELEAEARLKADRQAQAGRELELTARAVEDLSTKLAACQASEKSLLKQVEVLKTEVESSRRAQAEARKEKESLGEVRVEMEKELEHLLKQKDDQVRGLEAKLLASEKTRREQSRDLEHQAEELDEMHKKVESLQKDGAGRVNDHQKYLDSLIASHARAMEELQRKLELEERQKIELALNLRSVEERGTADVSQLEAQKAQLELTLGALQVQLQEEQQKCVDLSEAVGEAQHRLTQLEVGTGGEEVRRAYETEVHDLRERLRVAEEKLLDAQSMRDMFAKETDMYRSELKVSREERIRMEEELLKSQERLRGLSAAQEPGQQVVIEALQKDFDSRVERYRDEVQYLRQKCDEKERRCEQLLAEKSSLAAELRSGWKPTNVAEEDVEAGKTVAKPATHRSAVRTMSLAAPAWLRGADEPLRFVVKTLSLHPEARLLLFVYVVFLHAWVLFVLHQSAQGHT